MGQPTSVIRIPHELLPISILFVRITRLIDDFFVFLKPLVCFVPIKGDIAHIGFAFVKWGLVRPSHIFFKSIAYSHGVVGRMALIGSKGRLIGSHHEIHTNVSTRKVIDGLMIALEHEQHIRGIRDKFVAELHSNTFRGWLNVNLIVRRLDKSRCWASQIWLLIHLVRSFLPALAARRATSRQRSKRYHGNQISLNHNGTRQAGAKNIKRPKRIIAAKLREDRSSAPAPSFNPFEFCLVVVPFGHDDAPEILHYENPPICPIGADGRHNQSKPAPISRPDLHARPGTSHGMMSVFLRGGLMLRQRRRKMWNLRQVVIYPYYRSSANELSAGAFVRAKG